MEIEELENLIGITYKIYLYESEDDWAKIIKAVYKITKAEYKQSKELLQEYKAKYGEIISENAWNHVSLSLFEDKIKQGKAKSVEEAAKLFENIVDSSD